MLNFQLDQSRSDLTWNWLGSRWVCGSSWVEPFQHPMLEHFAVTDGRSTLLVVRERQAATATALPLAGRASQVDVVTYEQYVREVRTWPLEFLSVEHCHRDDGFVLRAGQWGTAPIYLVESGPRLRGSWSWTDLRGYLRADRLNELEIARVLTHHDRYSRETLFEDVHRLTERAEATFGSGHGLQLAYPAPAVHKKPRKVWPGLDVIGIYEEELERAVAAWPYRPRETAIELSGGMDSANVAMTLAARGEREILAYALIFGGDIGQQQLRRRREMIEYCGFKDLRIDALEYAPLMTYGARAAGDAISPLAEAFHEAVERMLDQARACGISTVFTGDGGDELLGLRAAEWESLNKVPSRFNPNQQLPVWLGQRTIELVGHVDSNLAPSSVINHATLLGFAARTPQFMEARMWPLSPLCSPRLIELCEQLPLEWRHGKSLCRERLRRLGFSDEVINPPLRENFRHVMEYGLAEFGMPLLVKLLDDSILVDHGYVDADGLRAAHDRITGGGAMDTSIFAFLRTELGVRSMVA